MHRRHAERSILKRKLIEGVNIHMPAPRRIGKTWTITRLAEDLRETGWLVVELDVQGLDCPKDFARELCREANKQISLWDALWANIKLRFENIGSGGITGNPMEAIAAADPVALLEKIADALSRQAKPTAILIDEIAFFVLALAEKNPAEAKKFLHRLREIQHTYQQKVHWLVTGSIGLDVVAERFGLGGAFVDLERFDLAPFTEVEARSFLRDDAIQRTFNHQFTASDVDLAFLFTELGWLAPYYLKLVGNAVCPSGPLENDVPTATRVDFEAAFNRLLSPGRKTEFAVWREHIDKNLAPSDRPTARTLLDALSQAADGETLDTLRAKCPGMTDNRIRSVLGILESDGLVLKEADRYRFRSGLIRRYWKEYEAE